MSEQRKRKSEEFFTREELAKHWGVSWKTIGRMMKDGRLNGVVYLSATAVRIPRSAVEECERRAFQPIIVHRERTEDGRRFRRAGAAR